METLVTFKVTSSNLAAFKFEFAKLVKKAAKLNVLAPAYEIVSTKEVEAAKNHNGAWVPAYSLHTVTVSGQAPKIAGWMFVATLQHEEGGNIVRRVPGTEAILVGIDLRTVASDCGHCNVSRRRLDTYVVAHDDGRQLQVGRQCLRDFTGHDSPEAIARWAEYLYAFETSVNEGGGGGGYGVQGLEVGEYLGYVVATIRTFGEWLSRTKAREFERSGTADLAWSAAFPIPGTKKSPVIVEDADITRANAALEYARTYFEAQENAGVILSDYEHNLRLTSEGRYVEFRSAGIAASLIQFVERLQGKAMERKAALASEYVGTVGKRETFTLTVVACIDLYSEMYGASTLHLLSDDKGNRFTWKTASTRLDGGTQYNVKGTVKSHAEYKGVKQTQLSRCKAEKVEIAVVVDAVLL